VTRVDWRYHRNGWTSCAKAQGFLAKKKIAIVETVDTKKSPIVGDAALAVARDVDEIYVAKGKKVVQVDIRASRPGRAELLALLLGPTGGLRAPTLRVGRTLLVGFSEEAYAKILR
jgi:arsenate reductase-like glutaredoxin family protein